MLQHQRQNFAKEFINKTIYHVVSLIFTSLFSVFMFAVSLLWTSLSVNREAVVVVAHVFLSKKYVELHHSYRVMSIHRQ